MDTTLVTEPPRRDSLTFSRLFKPRPTSRKIKKRNSMPAQLLSEKPSYIVEIIAAESDDARPKEKKQPQARQSLESHQLAAGADAAVAAIPAPIIPIQAADPNFRPPPVQYQRQPQYQPKHQRPRSTSWAGYRPRYESNFLKPVPLRSALTMGSVMGPTPSYAPHSSSGYSRESIAMRGSTNRNSVARSDRSVSASNVMGPAYQHAQQQRPNRLPASMMGNYAQIDSQANIYQRRPSTSSSVASNRTSDSFDAILSSSPSSTRTSFESWQSGPVPQNGYQRPALLKQARPYRRRREQGEILAALPDEVLGLVLDNLRASHLAPNSVSCATCMMRDFCSVALSSKKLLKAAQIALYEDIQLVGADTHTQKKRLKLNFGSRLVLLRRSIRANPTIAVLVKSLKAPAVPQGVPLDQYQNLVASIIMACPNFERLVGFHQGYDFSFNRLFHALATREQLTEMHWTLEASRFQMKRRMSNAAPMLNAGNPNYQEAPGDLHPQQSHDFQDLHADWSNLETLSIHCLPGATLTPVSLLPDIIANMPALKNLHLSHLPFTAFNDANLLSLPSLECLTLSHLPGISSEGLSSFARRPSSLSIKKLTLNHVDVDSLPAIAQLLSNLTNLETFTLVQALTPLLPANEMIWLYPYLASPSIKKIHWDLTAFTSCATAADDILAKSIAARGFPALTTLRTPNDPDGIFQMLCRPLDRIEQASDRFRGLVAKAGNSATITKPRSPPDSPMTPTTPKTTPGLKSPGASGGLDFPMADELFPSKVSSNLAQSRMAAQSRLEAARARPGRFIVNVVDDDGSISDTWAIGSFIGTVGSKVAYCVTPDRGAQDENGGVVDVGDFLKGDGGEDLRDGAREGCNGRWNSYAYSGYSGHGAQGTDRKERERWWHTERGRWRGIEL
ncbi:hypothetical protein F5Y15DRAFT_428498 [Xylariaceae sp. FL0016]|nr:hypothetical protein F5Y15DRAFT_428498 [Xylariaceae sp. FL0016]